MVSQLRGQAGKDRVAREAGVGNRWRIGSVPLVPREVASVHWTARPPAAGSRQLTMLLLSTLKLSIAACSPARHRLAFAPSLLRRQFSCDYHIPRLCILSNASPIMLGYLVLLGNRCSSALRRLPRLRLLPTHVTSYQRCTLLEIVTLPPRAKTLATFLVNCNRCWRQRSEWTTIGESICVLLFAYGVVL